MNKQEMDPQSLMKLMLGFQTTQVGNWKFLLKVVPLRNVGLARHNFYSHCLLDSDFRKKVLLQVTPTGDIYKIDDVGADFFLRLVEKANRQVLGKATPISSMEI